MDEFHFEHAAKIELAVRERAIQEAQRRVAASKVRPEDFNGTCPMCEEPIPEPRIAAGYSICVECKALEEKQKKQQLH